MNPQPPKRHIVTCALEDYFQVGAFNRVIQQGQWYRFETRLEKNTERTLALFDRHNIKATYFVLGWIADRFPELVKRVADRGHEIASKGYHHRRITGMTPAEFRDDMLRSREALEHACGRKVVGYRMADGWFQPEDLWALDVLADLGFEYDSSIAPIGRTFANEPFRRFAHRHAKDGRTIWELPISTRKFLGFQLPIAGGNYLRQFPNWMMRHAIRRWDKCFDSPLVLYFHAWELDPDQPTISASSTLTRIRHYRNLHKMEGYLDTLFKTYAFTGAADALGIAPQPRDDGSRHYLPEIPAVIANPENPPDIATDRQQVTIVIPCYNEELILPYLSNTLASVRRKLAGENDVTFLLVDDGSKDNTWAGLQQTFGDRPGFELYRHEHNQGVSAAIMTGIRRAKTEIVCSMDCDCTYDPHELANMIPKLRPGVDLVTASPYHPEGHVRNVPAWRLKLSKGASWLYRRVLHHKLHTYTSCFRIYRRSAVIDLDLKRTNFLGVAELIGKLDLQGSRIVEYPATLEVRMLGRSKMKTVRTILGHLRLLSRLIAIRMRSPKVPAPPKTSPVADDSAETPAVSLAK
jgi:polysaccharide deacetylase family protein (PEP-CTERM system associated)